MSQREVVEKIKRYCSLLTMRGIEIDRAFLYGSWARNEASDNSDIDVMLISPMFDTFNPEMKAKAWRLTEEIDLRIEPYTVGLKKFQDDSFSPIIQVVKEHGIEIDLKGN
jgi:uncharacterized protein